jgi:hypothetical protein
VLASTAWPADLRRAISSAILSLSRSGDRAGPRAQPAHAGRHCLDQGRDEELVEVERLVQHLASPRDVLAHARIAVASQGRCFGTSADLPELTRRSAKLDLRLTAVEPAAARLADHGYQADRCRPAEAAVGESPRRCSPCAARSDGRLKRSFFCRSWREHSFAAEASAVAFEAANGSRLGRGLRTMARASQVPSARSRLVQAARLWQDS